MVENKGLFLQSVETNSKVAHPKKYINETTG